MGCPGGHLAPPDGRQMIAAPGKGVAILGTGSTVALRQWTSKKSLQETPRIFLFFFFFGLYWVFVAAHRLSLVVVCCLLIAFTSLVVEHRLWGT